MDDDGGIWIPEIRVRFKEWTCKLYMTRYGFTGNVCLKLHDASDSMPVASASVNPHRPNTDEMVKLPDDRIMVKDYSENRGMLKALQAANVISTEPDETYDLHFDVYELLLPIPAGLVSRQRALAGR